MIAQEHPIAAIATALAPSALAVIRTSGEGAIELLATRFSKPETIVQAAGNSLVHGHLTDSEGRTLDEVLVSVFRSPKSYTGEDGVEISCHGSPVGVRRIFAELLAAGFAAAEPGEFTRRAFSNGKLDLTQAEAVQEVVQAQTAAAHALAVDRLGGAVTAALAEARERLVQLMAALSIQLDYPEEETGTIPTDIDLLQRTRAEIESIASTFARGRLLQSGVSVVLAGRTNAGKSSLFNALLGSDRSIVSETHGTTRDYLEGLIDLEGIPVRLFDTAGLRGAEEAVEREGIRRTEELISAADMVLNVVDGTLPGVDADDTTVRALADASVVLNVLTKADLLGAAEGPSGTSLHAASSAGEPIVLVSAVTGTGIEQLTRMMRDRILQHAGVGAGEGIAIDSERQHSALRRAAHALVLTEQSVTAGLPADVVAVDLQEAIAAVGEVTGEVTTAEILDQMFSSFCVGK